jgi:hypothetical protein
MDGMESWVTVPYKVLNVQKIDSVFNKKSYEIVERNILGYKTGQHIIFYRIMNKKEIEVIRILHGKMDLKSHL